MQKLRTENDEYVNFIWNLQFEIDPKESKRN